MVEVRACLFVSVVVLCFHIVAGKPIFEFLWCDLTCDDDDVSTSTTASSEDFFDWFSCDDCPRRRRRTSTVSPLNTQGPVNFMIPPANGVNLTLNNQNGSWWVNFAPWLAPATTPGGAPGGAAMAAATTAAPGATTAAAAAAATTAAATTAASK